MKTNIFAQAEANWPEDEASITADGFKQRIENGWTAEENQHRFNNDVAHMRMVFLTEPDGRDLLARYELALKNKHGLQP